jgi:hypothetical protein
MNGYEHYLNFEYRKSKVAIFSSYVFHFLLFLAHGEILPLPRHYLLILSLIVCSQSPCCINNVYVQYGYSFDYECGCEFRANRAIVIIKQDKIECIRRKKFTNWCILGRERVKAD